MSVVSACLLLAFIALTESKSDPIDSFDAFVESIGDFASSQCRRSFSPQRIARGLCSDVQLLVEDTFSLRIAAFLDDAEIHETHFLALATEKLSWLALQEAIRVGVESIAGESDTVFLNWKAQRSAVFDTHVVGRVDDWFMSQFHEIVEANLQRNPPSDEELRRIAVQTGVDPEELVEKYRRVRVQNAQKENPDAFDRIDDEEL